MSMPENLELPGVFYVLERYDHASLGKPKVKETTETSWRLAYEEGRELIDSMNVDDPGVFDRSGTIYVSSVCDRELIQ